VALACLRCRPIRSASVCHTTPNCHPTVGQVDALRPSVPAHVSGQQ
jgi:hypothetical protein